MRLPAALSTDDDSAVLDLLRRYYRRPPDGEHGFTGSAFDTWDPSGTRATSADVFTADDVVAVSLLSVDLSGRAAHELLVRRRDEFAQMLRAVGPDRDLVDEGEPIAKESPLSQLFHALDALDGVGPTRATKLIARKRPRLRPVWDGVVARHLGVGSSYVEPLRQRLREADRALHRRLVRLGEEAELVGVSPLRVFDVVTWLEARESLRGATTVDEGATPRAAERDEHLLPEKAQEAARRDGQDVTAPTSRTAPR
ncbi:DUF6308 family protein [Pseudokineococcus basanitobsidens]|uniref:DUF6308 family protein n=1 Tax=Pseudokineococcus basanitobsidens TaxID=1926649 RepID=A0ABU8RF11_9ACTN